MEWGDLIPDCFDGPHLQVRLAHEGRHRTATIAATGACHHAVMDAWRRHSVPEYWRWYLLLTMLSALAWRSQTNDAPRVWFGTSLDGEVMMREDGGEATFALPVPEGAALVALGLPLRLNSASAQALDCLLYTSPSPRDS